MCKRPSYLPEHPRAGAAEARNARLADRFGIHARTVEILAELANGRFLRAPREG